MSTVKFSNEVTDHGKRQPKIFLGVSIFCFMIQIFKSSKKMKIFPSLFLKWDFTAQKTTEIEQCFCMLVLWKCFSFPTSLSWKRSDRITGIAIRSLLLWKLKIVYLLYYVNRTLGCKRESWEVAERVEWKKYRHQHNNPELMMTKTTELLHSLVRARFIFVVDHAHDTNETILQNQNEHHLVLWYINIV